jgi:predicted O-methyltransferase YrrM
MGWIFSMKGIAPMLAILLLSGMSFTGDSPFAGIDDPKVLPMLKRLPYTYGGMNISAADGRFLHDLIIKREYRRGLEVGTSNGYSALWLGLAFRKTNGKLITIEIEPRRAGEAMRNFKRAGLSDVIECRINDAFKEIPRISGDFDFVFLDAWKGDTLHFYRLLRSRIKEGGALTVHNVIDYGYAMNDFLKAVRSDPSFEVTLQRTGPSGILLCVKKSPSTEASYRKGVSRMVLNIIQKFSREVSN